MTFSSVPDDTPVLPQDPRHSKTPHTATDYLVFKSAGLGSGRVELEDDLRFVFWRPSPWRIRPPTFGRKIILWWLAHYLRVFRNRDYAVLLIAKGDIMVHRSCAIPACFRWGFMPPGDIQVSSTWTAPEFRGGGLATLALRELTVLLRRPGRQFWYVTRVNNAASVAVCCKAGFQYVGTARRTARLGMRILGSFEMPPDTRGEEDLRRIA
jgi:RimJ/RimL family protein N-acetyltransferase